MFQKAQVLHLLKRLRLRRSCKLSGSLASDGELGLGKSRCGWVVASLWLRALVWLHLATRLIPVCSLRQDGSFCTRAAGILHHQPNGPGMSQGNGFGFPCLSSSVFLSLSHILLQPIFVSNNKNATERHPFWYTWSSCSALWIITPRKNHARQSRELCASFATVFGSLNSEITLL